MTVGEWQKRVAQMLSGIYGEREAANISRWALCYYLRMNERELAGHAGQELTGAEETAVANALRRLEQHEPIQYVLGEADFYGLKFKVDPAVLIPRPETEELVHWIINDLKTVSPVAGQYKILDIGTGSGIIPITLKKHFPRIKAVGIEISDEALRMAEENAALNGVSISFLKMDVLDEAQWYRLGSFNVIVSNPPYIADTEKGKMQKNVLDYEPQQALFTGTEDALLFYKVISKLAKEKLAREGSLYFEINQYRAEEIQAVVEQAGFGRVEVRKDLSGNRRMLKAAM